MLSYFNPASFARAKKNTDNLQKSNPQNPVLKDEDEKFLKRVASSEKAAKKVEDVETTKIADDGEETVVAQEDVVKKAADQLVVPETQPGKPEISISPTETNKKDKSLELPSQEEAEAATRGWSNEVKPDENENETGGRRTWASYLPTIGSKKNGTTDDKNDQKDDLERPDSNDSAEQRTWAQYASSYVPSVPASWKKSTDQDSSPEPVYNEDGTINEEKTKEKQEQEISVLLDQLNMSAINNRVFAFSAETQKLYERFALVLKDTINGVPTAYEDMEKLMKEAGPQLEAQFKAMPPFVRTLVKSLPAKLSAAVGPELLAASSKKPGLDLKTKQKATAGSTAPKDGKKKRRLPTIKSLISKEGAVATILRNTVTFLQTRFPFLASTTNVVMSLAVFILMFVFWYCHKRGKEVRLAKAAEGEEEVEAEGEEDGEDESEEDGEEEDASTEKASENAAQADLQD